MRGVRGDRGVSWPLAKSVPCLDGVTGIFFDNAFRCRGVVGVAIRVFSPIVAALNEPLFLAGRSCSSSFSFSSAVVMNGFSFSSFESLTVVRLFARVVVVVVALMDDTRFAGSRVVVAVLAALRVRFPRIVEDMVATARLQDF